MAAFLGTVNLNGGGGGGGSVNSVSAGTGITVTGTATNPVVNLTTPVTVSNGGSGATTLTGILKGNGTSAFTAAVAGTDYVAPGAVTTSGLTMTTSRLLGRTTALTGAIEEITVSSPITLTGGVLDFDETVNLGNNARVAVSKNSGATVGTRRRINFIEGTNVTLTVADDAGNEEVDVTIAATGSSGANTALSNLASVAMNVGPLSSGDGTMDVGSTSKHWRSGYWNGNLFNAQTFDLAWIECTSTYSSIGHNTAGNYGGRVYAWTVGGVGGVTISDPLGSAWPLSVRAGALLAVDASSSTGAGDSGFKKSAASGGNFSYQYDGTEVLRDDGTNVRWLQSRKPGIYNAIGDTSAVATFGGAQAVNATAGSNVGTGEDDLQSITLLANSLTENGDRVEIQAAGSFAANGNNKTVKLYFGSTVIFGTGAAAFNGGFWSLRASVVRTGAATQISVATWIGSTLVSSNVTVATPSATLSSTVTIKVTGEATDNNDITSSLLIVDVLPVQ